jgi:hypothetical protein
VAEDGRAPTEELSCVTGWACVFPVRAINELSEEHEKETHTQEKRDRNYTPKERSLGGSLINGGNDAKFDKQFEVKITGFCTCTQFGNSLFSYCWL